MLGVGGGLATRQVTLTTMWGQGVQVHKFAKAGQVPPLIVAGSLC